MSQFEIVTYFNRDFLAPSTALTACSNSSESDAWIIWRKAKRLSCFEELDGTNAHDLPSKFGDCPAAIVISIGGLPFAIRNARLNRKGFISRQDMTLGRARRHRTS